MGWLGPSGKIVVKGWKSSLFKRATLFGLWGPSFFPKIGGGVF